MSALPGAHGPLAGAAFWKMSGGGNDFVVFDNRVESFPKGDAATVAALCARGTGVGADAVLLLEPAEDGADFRMTYYNADGSEAPMCGNGALCIARFASELGVARGSWVTFETGAGLYRAELFRDAPSRVRLAMREPRGIRPSLPEIEALGYARAGVADTGTPHVIVLVDDLERVDVARAGRALRHHALFQPRGVNVDFVTVAGPGELAIRTYEKGVEAETLSCGTGAAAAAILTRLWGLTEPPVVVHPPGGFELRIAFAGCAPEGISALTLEGDARIVFSGRLGETPAPQAVRPARCGPSRADSAQLRARDRSSWPVRLFRLGGEPAEDLSRSTTAEQRLEMMWPLALEAWSLSGGFPPDRSRADAPVQRLALSSLLAR